MIDELSRWVLGSLEQPHYERPESKVTQRLYSRWFWVVREDMPMDPQPWNPMLPSDHGDPCIGFNNGQRGIASGERRILFSYGFMGHAQTFHNKAVSLVADQITAVPDRINGGTTGCGINPASERHGSSDALNPLLVLWITGAISVKAHCLRAAAPERLERCVSLQRNSDATQVSFLRC